MEHEKDYKIVVNAEEVTVHQHTLTFDEIVKIAFPNPPSGMDPEFTVTFEKAESRPHQGTLSEGQSVTVRDGTIFDVTHTNRS